MAQTRNVRTKKKVTTPSFLCFDIRQRSEKNRWVGRKNSLVFPLFGSFPTARPMESTCSTGTEQTMQAIFDSPLPRSLPNLLAVNWQDVGSSRTFFEQTTKGLPFYTSRGGASEGGTPRPGTRDPGKSHRRSGNRRRKRHRYQHEG